MLAAYDRVMEIILPTLGPERRATYSPFLPISARSGKVLQVPMIGRDVASGTVTYVDPDTGEEVETPVTGGRVKCQWKADWAMRWVALGVDYEMAGKDLIESVKLSGEICRALGATPPEGFNYELFLDEQGQKISKSKGNGLTIDEWLRYASPESLSLFMYRDRGRRSVFTSTSSRARSTTTSNSSRATSGRTSSSACPIRSGTFIPARRRAASCRSRSRCCSRWSRPPTRRTPKHCGASLRATGRA